MGLFFKKNWKWFAIGTVVVVLLIVGILSFRVLNFVNGVKADRVGDAAPTLDTQAFAQATITAEARRCAAAENCVTATTGNFAAVTTAPAPTATPDLSKSKIVQRIKAGDRINVLYMGYGGSGHEGEYLTDTILVLSFDPKTQTVTEFNVPRDLYLSVPAGPNGKSFKSKANGIFSTIMKWDKPNQDELDPKYHWTNDQEKHAAAANLVANTIQNVLGLKIDYWFTMNFNGFRTLIDKMGGVTVCVDRAFEDDQYPRNDNDKIDASVMTIKFEKGCQVMNGERAIQFARSRHSESLEGGDFARSARQMKVIAAIKEEILKKNLLTSALDLMDALQTNLRVSMDGGDLLALANYLNSSEGKDLAKNLKFDPEIISGNNFVKDIDKGGDIGYALIPQAGEDKFGEIQAWVQKDFNYTLIRRDNVRIQVLNGTGLEGKAQAVTDFLDDQGFRLSEPDKTANEDTTYLVDYTNGEAVGNIEQLKKFLPNMKVYSKPKDKKPWDGSPDLFLFLGKDYKGMNTAASPAQAVAAPAPGDTPKP
ncbi:MAG TPA: LCP family protein [Chloroflexia bacterium]|nr:LCP family protein [Chloroflexia bacterium]